ncbi:nuclear transport factor 2 family protein [Winogradskyella sp. A3E31]|uniref:nuclear transport factor 2 family protein n=1 Tax=Winogradskyella sp. A3E31 TaxID=3349637 RepID=UPI00398AEA73
MKKIVLLAFLAFSLVGYTQQSEEDQVKQTIETFFEAFHKQDTVALKTMAADNIIMQSIGKNKEGAVKLNQSDFAQFVKSIGSIPKDKTFEEKLFGFNIQVDGAMANAWTPYEFWFDGNFSHCGVNSFQLMKVKEDWKIIYLVDTRRREGCQD